MREAHTYPFDSNALRVTSQSNSEPALSMRPRAPMPRSVATLESFSERTGTTTSCLQRGADLRIRRRQGHLYPAPEKHVPSFQRERGYSLATSRLGLTNLRAAYDAVHGAPAFLHRLLALDPRGEAAHVARYPQAYPYFEEERLLVVPNIKYDADLEMLNHPRAQKLKDAGVKLNAWFVHPRLCSLTAESRQVLGELSQPLQQPQPQIEALRRRFDRAPAGTSAGPSNERDEHTIEELKQHAPYLASILDLDASHVGMLDRSKSFTLDELIDGLASGKTIDDVILARQAAARAASLPIPWPGCPPGPTCGPSASLDGSSSAKKPSWVNPFHRAPASSRRSSVTPVF
jgi:hypothetical protein